MKLKDITKEELLGELPLSTFKEFKHPYYVELIRRLAKADEADALRKENDALKLRIAKLQSMLDRLGGSD